MFSFTKLHRYALDQRPFSRYIEKKEKQWHFKTRLCAYKLGKQYKKNKKIIKMRKARKSKNKTFNLGKVKYVKK